MEMTKDDYVLLDVYTNIATFLCRFSGFNKSWPKHLYIEDVMYKFGNQTIIPKFAIGNYAGCACYIKENK